MTILTMLNYPLYLQVLLCVQEIIVISLWPLPNPGIIGECIGESSQNN